MEELLDILDENGNPTGESKPRSVVHATGLWHRTVHIYFYRKTDYGVELLVHHRSTTKDLNPNKWDTRFGGHLKAGETLEIALKNELKEEVGIQVNPGNLTEGPINRTDKLPNSEFTNVYFYRFDGDINFLKFNDGEVQAVKWMKAEDVLNSITNHPQDWTSRPSGFAKIKDLLYKL